MIIKLRLTQFYCHSLSYYYYFMNENKQNEFISYHAVLLCQIYIKLYCSGPHISLRY